MAAKGKQESDGKWLLKQLVMAVGAAFLTVVVILFIFKIITRHGKEIIVPNVVGLTMQQAKQVARDHHVRIKVSDSTYVPRMQKGLIYRQNPAPGSNVKKGRRVIVIVNSIVPKMSKVPNVVGQPLRQAQGNLNSAKFRVGKLIYTPDIATNNVISQLYKGRPVIPGTEIPAESEIDLEVGLGASGTMTRIPNLHGLSFYDVKNELVNYCLNLNKMVFDSSVKSYADTVNSFVYKQFPAPTKSASHKLGAGVTLYLTTNKDLVKSTAKQ